MKKKVNPFLGTVRAVAIAMGKKSGLTVRFEGTKACTDGTTIWLPASLPEDESIITKVRGYVDHEAAHVEMTDFELPSPSARLIHTLMNIIEDIRIEKKKGLQYPGCAVNFRQLVDALVAEGTICPPPIFLNTPTKAALAYFSYGARTQHLRHNLQEVSEAWRTKVVEVLGEPIAKIIDRAIKEISWCNSTADARELAEEVFSNLQNPPEPEQQSESQSSSEPESGDGEQREQETKGSDSSPSSSKDSTSNEEKDPGQPGDESSESEGEGEQEQSTDQSADASDSDGSSESTEPRSETSEHGDSDPDETDSKGEDNPSESEGEGDGQVSSSASEPDDNNGEMPPQDDQGEGGNPDASASGDTGDSEGQQSATSGQDDSGIDETALEELINASEEELSLATESIDISNMLEKGLDQVGSESQMQQGRSALDCTACNSFNAGESPLADAISAMCRNTAGLRAKMAGLFQATKLKRDTPQLVGHKIDRRTVHRIAAMTPDTRVFQSRRDKVDKNTAIIILVDKSSSMRSMITLAVASAFSVAKAVDSMPGVSVAVAGYPHMSGVVLLKGFNERAKPGRFAISASGGTPTAQALRWAGQEIWPRPETRKIVLTLTDGEPNDYQTAREMADLLRENSIEAYSIGIGAAAGSACSRVFGEECSQEIKSIDELGDAMFATLTNALTRKAA